MSQDQESEGRQAATGEEQDANLAAPEERIAALEAELAKAKEDMLRALAEAQNVRRRAEKEAGEARIYAIERFARDLLPIADTLARALTAAPAEVRQAGDEAMRSLIEGVEMTERTLLEAFGRHQLRPVGAQGDRFDPNLHQAVAQIPSDLPAQHIAEVLQPGFVLGDRTLRPAMVVLSLGQGASSAPAANEGGGVNITV